MSYKHRFIKILWDFWCLISIVGIWPRYIEPYLIVKKNINIKINNLNSNLKLLHFSDLHIHAKTPKFFLKKLAKKINSYQADLIFFTGDFLRFAQIDQITALKLKTFLNTISSKYGCYAVLGNHDYQNWVSINSDGYISSNSEIKPAIIKGFNMLFKKKPHSATEIHIDNSKIKENTKLIELLQNSQFKLLNNLSETITVGNQKINIVGIGEYWLNRCIPNKAFQNIHPDAPIIALLHNPDGLNKVTPYKPDLILCGHTHGGQVNIPWMNKKFTPTQNLKMKYGLIKYNGCTIFISKGVGASEPFRWFTPPEIVQIQTKNLS